MKIDLPRLTELEESNDSILGDRISTLHSCLAQCIILSGIVHSDDKMPRETIQRYMCEIGERLVAISHISLEIDQKTLGGMLKAFSADFHDSVKKAE